MLFFRNTKQTTKNVAEATFKHKEIINLVENETIFQNDSLIADTFNKYFFNIVKKIIYSKDLCSEDQFSNLRAKSSHRKI